MSAIRLSAEERLTAAFDRYDDLWPDGDAVELAASRSELCCSMLELGEVLPPQVRAQMARDQGDLARGPADAAAS